MRLTFAALPLLALATVACHKDADDANKAAGAADAAATAAAQASGAAASAAASAADASKAAADALVAGKPLAAVTAFGKDFRAVVDAGKVSLEGPAITAASFPVTSEVSHGAAVYHAGANGKLVIEHKACTDAQATAHDWSATLVHGGKTYTGCADAGAMAHAPT